MKSSYLDASRTPAERTADLLARMTLEEKAHQLTSVLPNHISGTDGPDEARMAALLGAGIGQIAGASLGAASPVEIARLNNRVQRFLRDRTRLGIPAILHNEALNGAMGPRFTSFPTAIGLAATWDPERVRLMGALINRQLRSVGVRQALSPVLDVARDARWGRMHETFGEEVLLVSAMGAAYVDGIQGVSTNTGVIATGKHFLGYATTEGGQNTAATRVGPRELHDVYAAPFQAAISLSGLRSVMNSYSELDGEPVVHSRAVLTDLLRGRMGFDGTVVSDYRSIQYAIERLGAAPDAAASAALALRAGLDVELPAAFGYGQALVRAVRDGLADERDVDIAVRRVLQQKFELGLFDDPFVDEEPIAIDELAIEGRDLARELAEESMTLVSNESGLLPLSSTPQRVAVIGPHATTIIGSFANYTYPPLLEMIKGIADGRARMNGMEAIGEELPLTLREAFDRQVDSMISVDPEQMVREMYDAVGLAEALATEAPYLDVESAAGSGVLEPIDGGLETAAALAAGADVVVLALGGRSGAFAGNSTEGEGTDSATMELPRAQLDLLDAVSATGTPVVTVIMLGRPYALAEVVQKSAALLLNFYPGPAGAPALARVLTGRLSPSGKLPFTLPRTVGQVPIYQAMKRGSGYRRLPKDIFKGYLDMPSTPLFGFGHGLSYVGFEYSALCLERDRIGVLDSIEISLTLENTGSMVATEVVQLYLGLPGVGVTRPAQTLTGFARVRLDPGEAVSLVFDVPMGMCGYTSTDGRFVVEPGTVQVRVGASSDDIRLEGSFEVVGERTPVGDAREFVSRAWTVPLPARSFGNRLINKVQ